MSNVTQILAAVRAGDLAPAMRLFERVDAELRQVAGAPWKAWQATTLEEINTAEAKQP